MDFFEAFERSASEFERRLRLVREDQWGDPTPCEEWTVRELVNHVVGAGVLSTELLHGGSAEAMVAGFGREYLGDDPVQAYLDSVDEQRQAFAEPGALERTCHHRLGDIPGWQLLGFRVTDHLLHAWDLARAIGADEHLDQEVVELIYGAMAGMGDGVAATGVFGTGASGAVADDAPTQAKLLDLAGRRP